MVTRVTAECVSTKMIPGYIRFHKEEGKNGELRLERAFTGSLIPGRPTPAVSRGPNKSFLLPFPQQLLKKYNTEHLRDTKTTWTRGQHTGNCHIRAGVSILIEQGPVWGLALSLARRESPNSANQGLGWGP